MRFHLKRNNIVSSSPPIYTYACAKIIRIRKRQMRSRATYNNEFLRRISCYDVKTPDSTGPNECSGSMLK